MADCEKNNDVFCVKVEKDSILSGYAERVCRTEAVELLDVEPRVARIFFEAGNLRIAH